MRHIFPCLFLAAFCLSGLGQKNPQKVKKISKTLATKDPSKARRDQFPKKTVHITPELILEKVDEFRAPQGSMAFKVRVKDYSEGKLDAQTVYEVFSKDSKHVLIETIEPKRLTGRKLLVAGAMWLYLPTLKRPTQVGMSQRLTGEVSNGDIARMNFREDYRARILGIDKIKNVAYWKLELTAKDETAPYRALKLWAKKDSFEPKKVEYFALSGKLLKTGEYSEPVLLMGKPRMSTLKIKDSLNSLRQSHLNFFDYKKEEFEDSFFEKESLD